jgi:hypothetical protein
VDHSAGRVAAAIAPGVPAAPASAGGGRPAARIFAARTMLKVSCAEYTRERTAIALPAFVVTGAGRQMRRDLAGSCSCHQTWQPEAALAGAASGGFASAGPPMRAPVESSAAFLALYQDLRGGSA